MSEVIDIHLHFGAPEGEGSPCYWSTEFTHSMAYLAMLVVTGSLFKKVNIHRIKEKLLKVINSSQKVDKVVLLAMDEVYDNQGNAHRGETHLFVPNYYLANLAFENERVLFGASVHPYRDDWESEMEFCLSNGAVLCKWIPSSMQIDPSHQKCLPFYEKLVEADLPLLCHCGPELAIPTSNNDYEKFNNPKYLKNALDVGVKVIVAHCSMPFWGVFEDDSDFLQLGEMLTHADDNNWNLYADLSALCIPMREPYIKKVRETFPWHRLVFGSDYPIPITEFTYNASASIFKKIQLFLKSLATKNPLDKNYILVQGMQLGDDIFNNASQILRY
jgi:predicted TIM-barrel fold metal-dependent hydrolase